MTRRNLTTCALALAIAALPGAVGWRIISAMPAEQPATGRTAEPGSAAARVERGAYLVRAMGCNDCHTPWKMGPRGPEPDMTRALTGHPSSVVMPAPPALPPGPWTWMGAETNTAFAGPWGVSFAANLTPDPDTGLGKWTEEIFIATLRNRRHEGKGRLLLPPMPAPMIAQLNDRDLGDIFAYLQSLPPVKNRVPAPIDPAEPQK
jgi:hypothetical protein